MVFRFAKCTKKQKANAVPLLRGTARKDVGLGMIVDFPQNGCRPKKEAGTELAPTPATRARAAAHAIGPSPTESSYEARIG
jgi:hypothetical protein